MARTTFSLTYIYLPRQNDPSEMTMKEEVKCTLIISRMEFGVCVKELGFLCEY